jgi:hypothetical protein
MDRFIHAWKREMDFIYLEREGREMPSLHSSIIQKGVREIKFIDDSL